MQLKGLDEYKVLTAICCTTILWTLLAFNVNQVNEVARQILLKLNEVHHLEGSGSKLKKYELLISDDGFIRYLRYFINGHQEYYSFNVLRFRDLDYIGNSSTGALILQTQDQDVIVQTYNDPRGNIDSMAYQVSFPVKDIEAEDLQLLRANL